MHLLTRVLAIVAHTRCQTIGVLSILKEKKVPGPYLGPSPLLSRGKEATLALSVHSLASRS